MYNQIQRCLIMSVKIQRTFLTQLIHENVLSHVNCANARRWNNAVCKRFYCQAPNNIENNQSSIDKMNDAQRFDKFLSDPKQKKYFQTLELEIDVMRHNDEKIPQNISPQNWLLLLEMKTKSQRKKLLRFLWSNEQTKENRRAKKELKKIEYLEKKAKEETEEDTDDLKYSLWKNSFLRRISKKTMNDFYNWKVVQAIMFEPKIVFDCGYEKYMTKREIHNCAKQLTIAFGYNREHFNPLHLYFCNLKDGLLVQDFKRNIPTLLDDDFPMTVTSQSYLDLFPKNQLTYLTPHCRIDLKEYDPDMIYIIGAMVDKSNPQPLSLAKAKEEGIRMAKLPLEKYLKWGSSSSKNLTLDQMLKILLDLKKTGDWKEALLKNIPTRKLKEAREHMLRKKIMRSFNSERVNTSKQETLKNFTFTSRKIS